MSSWTNIGTRLGLSLQAARRRVSKVQPNWSWTNMLPLCTTVVTGLAQLIARYRVLKKNRVLRSLK
jgi:hypothetical protein